MTSVQRFLANDRNRARTASVVASSVRTSSIVETLSVTREGNGRVALVGSYTGHAPTDIDIEISSGGTTPRATEPVFRGIGSGVMAVESVSGAAVQQALTFSLADLGIDTKAAGFDVRTVRIVDKAAGAAGNNIHIIVTPALTVASTTFALLADWPASQPVRTGEEWDFGALPLIAGNVNASSPRVRFGSDPTVYRLWKEYKDGAWHYGTSPALERDIAAGSRVFAVSGAYSVRVTNGTTPEDYAAVTTLHDLLSALNASALVEVAGVVVQDRKPGGMSVIDVPIRTASWFKSLTGKPRIQDIAVGTAAPTQAITVRCVNDDWIGAEVWQVEGTVSGRLANATTGVPFASVPISFLIPSIEMNNAGGGEWAFKYDPAGRSDDAPDVPSVCVRPFRFGVNAQPRTVSFRYQRRPSQECKCESMPTPKLSLKCLGLDSIGDTEMALDAEYKTRLESLYSWRHDFHESNTLSSSAVVRDMDYADSITAIFAEGLAQIYETALARTEWDAALTEMQADLLWLEGTGGSSLAQYQGGNVGAVWKNNSNDHYYKLTGVTAATVPVDGGPLLDSSTAEHTPEPAVSTVWLINGTSFTLSRTIATVAYVYTYKDEGLTNPAVGADLPNQPPAQAIVQLEVDTLVRKWRARMDYCLTIAGIVPKSDAGNEAGACWRDYPEDTHWWVDTEGYYLPAFSNRAYHSARRNTETGIPYSTREFGFGLVVACPERLREGDMLTIRILSVNNDRPYRAGDEAVIETVFGGPAYLTGGVDGTDELTWAVRGSVSGAMPSYIVAMDTTPALYLQDGVGVRITPGGIPFELGDVFTLSVESGRFRWRADAGAWSSLADIPVSGAVVLGNGVSASFVTGAAPSFVSGDEYAFRVHQPYASANVCRPTPDTWQWVGAAANIVCDLGAIDSLAAVAVALHDLPNGATLTAEWSIDAISWSAPVALIGERVAVHFPAPVVARYVRISVTSATGGRIGWVWAGVPLATEASAQRCVRSRRWSVSRGAAVNPAGLYRGSGDGWIAEWEHWLRESEAEQLLDMAGHLAEYDEPLIFVPHYLHTDDAAMVRLDAEQIEIADRYEYQPNDDTRRMLSATIPMEAYIG